MSLGEVATSLRAGFGGHYKVSEAMAKHTTYRIGGAAGIYAEADTLSDLTLILDSCRSAGVDHMVVGKGSNLLVSDGGYDGVVVVLGREFKKHTVEGSVIRSGAGVILAHAVNDAYSNGLAGLEFAVGVPGTVGGAIAMNAGSRREWIGGVIETVTVYDPARGLIALRHDDIQWGYRSTDMPQGGVVVECVMRLEQGERDEIRRSMDNRLAERRRHQPMGQPSAGSVFANPEGDSAGRLVESLGLKGHRIGDAQISPVHANFIVNCGHASATDVVRLMRLARSEVKERYGIELRPEIRFLGSFDET